jgi:putative hydrolase of the HAD superfamily
MIGDNYEADILGARNIGMHVIFFNNNKQDNIQNVNEIDRLIHLKKYL